MHHPESLKPNILNARCPSRKVLELIAGKWTLLVLVAISRGVIGGSFLYEFDIQ